MIEYTLEVWDDITGQWYTADSSTVLSNIMSGDVLNTLEDGTPWRIVKTEVVKQSTLQPIGY